MDSIQNTVHTVDNIYIQLSIRYKFYMKTQTYSVNYSYAARHCAIQKMPKRDTESYYRKAVVVIDKIRLS